MKVEIRIYKRYDTDLVALVDNGYPVCEMMKAAFVGYANGNPVHFKMDEHLYFDMNRKTNVRLRFEISSSDKKSIYLLKNIKHGYRNAFCKALLRESLSCQNLGCYFADPELIKLQESNANMGRQFELSVKTLRLKKESGFFDQTENIISAPENAGDTGKGMGLPVQKQAPAKEPRPVESKAETPKLADNVLPGDNEKMSTSDLLAAFEAL